MASVTQCDVCKSISKHEDTYYLELYTVDASGSESEKIHALELCSDCYNKIRRALGMGVRN